MYDILYRKDSKGKVNYWQVEVNNDGDSFTGKGIGSITIKHGKLGGKESIERVNCSRSPELEAQSRYKAKLKQGYKTVADVKDNYPLPVKVSLESYLSTYLPEDRTTADGALLPMLAKVYDNENNKLFKNNQIYLGQWKINGLRCFIRARRTNDIFSDIVFTFQSREGTFWNSLPTLNDYLRETLPKDFVNHMIEEEWILDGELYIPGLTINDLNSAVKTVTNPYNRYIQFWCYDIYMENTIQIHRIENINRYLGAYRLNEVGSLDRHLQVTRLFNVLPTFEVNDDIAATHHRNLNIMCGFEGLILRNPNLEYAAGKRKMIKYKKHTDGVFVIVDIIPDGIKRPDVAKIVCRNDINDSTFECHYSASIDFQKVLLKHKESYIGRKLDIEYGERTGVNQLPFHIKRVKFNVD